jgi:hypothetical protein
MFGGRRPLMHGRWPRPLQDSRLSPLSAAVTPDPPSDAPPSHPLGQSPDVVSHAYPNASFTTCSTFAPSEPCSQAPTFASYAW